MDITPEGVPSYAGHAYVARPLCQRRGVPAPDPLRATSVTELVVLVRELVAWAGSPSYRALALRTKVPKSSLFDLLKHSDRLPPYDLLFAVVKGCGAEDDWPRWSTARGRVSAARPARQTGESGRFYRVPAGWLYTMGSLSA